MAIEDVRLFLEKSQKLLILCHSNADPDAVGCAVAVRRCMPEKTVSICCDGISKPAKILLEALGEEISGGCAAADSVLVLDTSSPELLGKCSSYLDGMENVALVDHHSTCSFVDVIGYRDSRTSNSELIWELLDHPCDLISRKALLAGILADTGHLKFANKGTLKAVQEILGEDIVFEDVFQIMSDDYDLSKKIALMKALQRMKVKRAGDFVIIKSSIGAHESFIAKNMLSLGGDVVIIVNEKKGMRIVGRAKRGALDKGVDLSIIMQKVGEKYGGDGGGHPPAAGLMGIKDYKSASEDIVNMVIEILKG